MAISNYTVMIKEIEQTENEIVNGFNSLIFLSTISPEFKQQIKKVQKWQKKQQSPLRLILAALKKR